MDLVKMYIISLTYGSKNLRSIIPFRSHLASRKQMSIPRIQDHQVYYMQKNVKKTESKIKLTVEKIRYFTVCLNRELYVQLTQEMH